VGLLDKFRAASPEGQDWLEKMLRDAGQVDLPAQAVEQGYTPVPFYNVGAEGVTSYDMNAPRANNANAPVGVYSNVDKGWSDKYLQEQADYTGSPRVQNELVTTGQNVFVAGADKPSDAMIESTREKLAQNIAGASYNDLLGHQQDYIDEKMQVFSVTGDPTTLPSSFISAQDKTNIFTDAGYDMMLRNGNEFVHLKPEQTRSVDAAFDPELKGTNNWLAGAGGLGLLGATAMAPSESQAGEQDAAEVTDQDRYLADVQKAQEMAQSDDPAVQQRGQAWLDQFGGMASEDDSEPFDANYNLTDQPLWLAQAGETFLRDIGGAVSGMFDPETGREIRENRTLPATDGTDYLDQQFYGALGTALQPVASGIKRVADMPYNAQTVQMAANPYAMPMPSLDMQQDTSTLNEAIGFAAQEYDKLSDRQKRNVARAGNTAETISYILPGMGLLKKYFGGAN